MTRKKYPKLPAKYYLDKHFFPLANQLTGDIANPLIKDLHENFNIRASKEMLREIILDVLYKLKPSYKEAKKE